MHIPKGYTEKQIVQIAERIARKVGPKYEFAYYQIDDIVQEVMIILMTSKILEKYDASQPLENYLTRSIRNRLFNLKRNNYTKPNPPCTRCPLKAFIAPDGCSAYNDKNDCTFYKKWTTTNSSKLKILHATEINGYGVTVDKNILINNNVIDSLIKEEDIDKILFYAKGPVRKYILMHLDGVSLSKSAFNKLLDFIIENV